MGLFLRIRRRTTAADVIQGIIAGGVLAFFTANLVINAEVYAMYTTVNGWSTTLKCGEPGNGILLRAACASDIGALNLRKRKCIGRRSWTARVIS